MENPKEDIRYVVESVVQNLDLDLQRATFDAYFTENAQLLHPMCSAPNRQGIKSIFDVRSRILVHWSSKVVDAWYDPTESPDKLVVHVMQNIRPVWRFWQMGHHSTIALLELTDHYDEEKQRNVKMIQRQLDHMEKSMIADETPIVASVYDFYLNYHVTGWVLGFVDPYIQWVAGILRYLFYVPKNKLE